VDGRTRARTGLVLGARSTQFDADRDGHMLTPLAGWAERADGILEPEEHVRRTPTRRGNQTPTRGAASGSKTDSLLGGEKHDATMPPRSALDISRFRIIRLLAFLVRRARRLPAAGASADAATANPA